MKVNGRFSLAEGTEIENLTAPSGLDWPDNANDAELFQIAEGSVVAKPSLYLYRGGKWNDLLQGEILIEFLDASTITQYVLPDANQFTNRVFRVKRVDSSLDCVEVTLQPGQTIDGDDLFHIHSYESLTLIGREGHWYII